MNFCFFGFDLFHFCYINFIYIISISINQSINVCHNNGKETAVSTTTATPKSIRPLSYTNLLANSSNYLKHGSSSESLDSQVSNASTIKFTASSVSPTISPSPQTPQVQSQVRKKIQIPNYYVPPKVNIAPSISITESSDATNTTETIARPSLIRKSLVRLSNHP